MNSNKDVQYSQTEHEYSRGNQTKLCKYCRSEMDVRALDTKLDTESPDG